MTTTKLTDISKLAQDVANLSPQARAELLREAQVESDAAKQRVELLAFLCKQATLATPATPVTATTTPVQIAPVTAHVVKPTTAPRSKKLNTKVEPPAPEPFTAPKGKKAKAKTKAKAKAKVVKGRRQAQPLDEADLYTLHVAIAEGTNTSSDLHKKFVSTFPNNAEGSHRLKMHLRRLIREEKIEFKGHSVHGKYVSLKDPTRSG